ncbi:hypothetical protein RFI_26850 [Reticulomyxa filosa]|uniref:EF-hand domain-containing protein n=1 Tax=Reticulomyxa filosa TaxID=46433 RepID=X6MAN1_RETFI|nr:hypothetical protein RFI_26850 [Reticulomyxa filosa]|eukprot:ETO10527.1 hypothetical protein RFI_26850 [Reticulomyxa filosa]
MVTTIRFIDTMHFATDEEDKCEEWDKHDGMTYKGINYFTCLSKRGLFVKEVKLSRATMTRVSNIRNDDVHNVKRMEQVDLCLDCIAEITLCRIIIAKRISTIFELDQGVDHDTKAKTNTNEKTYSNFDLKLKNVFHFFDQDNDGTLKHANMPTFQHSKKCPKHQFDRKLLISPVTVHPILQRHD